MKERQPLRCNVQPESQNTCFPHNIIKNETGNIGRRMHITQNYHKKTFSNRNNHTRICYFNPRAPFRGATYCFLISFHITHLLSYRICNTISLSSPKLAKMRKAQNKAMFSLYILCLYVNRQRNL